MFRKYPSVFLLTGVVAGILLADSTHLPAWIFLLFCLACGTLAVLSLSSSRTRVLVIFCLGAVACFAGLRFALACYDLSADNVGRYADGRRTYQLFGTVTDWPDLKPELTEIRLDLDSLSGPPSVAIRGTVLLKITDTSTAVQRGDRIECFGRIYPVATNASGGSFNYQRYLSLKGISGIVYLPTLLDVRIDRRNQYGFFEFIDRLRGAIRASFYANLSPEAAALASGFLIGETRDISVDLYQRFRESGTLHLLAVSGSNVALVLVFFVAILRPFRISRKLRAIILMGIVVIFSFLSYGEPSVLRASVMAGLVLGATILERRYDLNNVIALAALLILLADPGQLFDVGFQLSFVIAWGLIFILPRLLNLLAPYHNKTWYRYVAFPLIVSLVAQICATGLIAIYFHRIPILSPIANLIVVPLVSIVVVGSLVLLLAHLVMPILGVLVGSWLNLIILAVVRSVELFGSDAAPGLRFDNVPATGVVVFYVLLAITAAAITNRRCRRVSLVSVIIVANGLLMIGTFSALRADSATQVNCFSIPGGVAATINRSGSNEGDLVLTGLKQTKYRIDEKVLIPALSSNGIEKISRLFVLAGEYGALDDLCRLAGAYKVDTILVSSKLLPSVLEVLSRDSVQIERVAAISFSDLPAERTGPGYFTFADGLAVYGEEEAVFFLNKLGPHIALPDLETTPTTIVLGQTWTISSETEDFLKSSGINAVVCSKIEQPAPSYESWSTEVHQLSLDGSFKLSLR